MILKLDNVFFQYGKNLPYILNGISYEFDKGKIYAVTGGSGSGKTTLISIIAALATPTTGKIYYDGIDTAEINKDKYRANCVSIIFQNYNLLYNYTATDNITTALHISGYTGNLTERAESLLNEVGIPSSKRKYVVQNLSGGEQQRIAIARALASDSSVILADEPTGNLDEVNKHNIMNIFRQLAYEYGKCVIIVTHSNEIALSVDEYITLINGGILQS